MARQFSINDGKSWKAPFFTIWAGQGFSLLGSQLVQFALIWYLTDTTGSVTVLATASLVGLLPNVVLGPFAGALVDRWNRRWTMVLSDSIIAMATLTLVVLFALDSVSIWNIYAIMFIRSLAGAFHTNAMSASTSLMVPVEHLTRIQGLHQVLIGALNIASAPMGALLLELLPMQYILSIDILTAAIAILPMVFIPIPQPDSAAKTGKTRSSVWQDFKDGLQYMLRWPGLCMICLMAVGINFTILPAFSLVPLLVKNHFGGGAVQLGWVEASFGIGMVIGGLLLSVWGGFKRKILTTMLGLLGMGAGALAIALAPAGSLILAILGSLLVGIMSPITNGPVMAIIQSMVDVDMQARIFSLVNSITAGMAPLGLMVASPVAARFGIQSWFLVSCISLVLMGLLILVIPAVLKIEERPGVLNQYPNRNFAG